MVFSSKGKYGSSYDYIGGCVVACFIYASNEPKFVLARDLQRNQNKRRALVMLCIGNVCLALTEVPVYQGKVKVHNFTLLILEKMTNKEPFMQKKCRLCIFLKKCENCVKLNT